MADVTGKRARGLANGSMWVIREERLRRAFLLSRGKIDAAEIERASGCRPGEAALVAAARRLVCLEVLEAFEREQLTFACLWRAASYCGDERRQRLVARLSASDDVARATAENRRQ